MKSKIISKEYKKKYSGSNLDSSNKFENQSVSISFLQKENFSNKKLNVDSDQNIEKLDGISLSHKDQSLSEVEFDRLRLKYQLTTHSYLDLQKFNLKNIEQIISNINSQMENLTDINMRLESIRNKLIEDGNVDKSTFETEKNCNTNYISKSQSFDNPQDKNNLVEFPSLRFSQDMIHGNKKMSMDKESNNIESNWLNYDKKHTENSMEINWIKKSSFLSLENSLNISKNIFKNSRNENCNDSEILQKRSFYEMISKYKA